MYFNFKILSIKDFHPIILFTDHWMEYCMYISLVSPCFILPNYVFLYTLTLSHTDRPTYPETTHKRKRKKISCPIRISCLLIISHFCVHTHIQPHIRTNTNKNNDQSPTPSPSTWLKIHSFISTQNQMVKRQKKI